MQLPDNDIKKQTRQIAPDRTAQRLLALDAALNLHWKLSVLAETEHSVEAELAVHQTDAIILHLTRSS